MVDMPFGVSRLDSMLDGGVPTGSVVLLATEPGAGGRKFAHTSAAINALATTNNAAFEHHYRGIDHEGVIVPASVHYLSVAATADSLEATLTETVSSEIAAQATDGITHHDLSETYFEATDVPEAWYQHDDPASTLPGVDTVEEIDATDPFEYAEDVGAITDDSEGEGEGEGKGKGEGEGESEGRPDAADGEREGIPEAANSDAETAGDTAAMTDTEGHGATDTSGILSALRASLDDAVGGNLVVIDAITDLDDLPEETVSWDAVVRLLRGLTRLVTARGGLVLVVADAEAVTDPQLGSLSAAATGTLSFAWETGGSQRARLLSIRELPSALDRLDRDEIAAFESELHDRGYDLSNVRKIH
jgi:archaellum biogenesis ATPase FlaH